MMMGWLGRPAQPAHRQKEERPAAIRADLPGQPAPHCRHRRKRPAQKHLSLRRQRQCAHGHAQGRQELPDHQRPPGQRAASHRHANGRSCAAAGL